MMGDEQSQKVIKPAPQTPAQKPNLQNRAPSAQNRTPAQTQSAAAQDRTPVAQSQTVSNQGGTHLRQPIPQNIAPTNEPELNLKDSQLYERVQPNDIIIKALNAPKQVYVGQIFSFTLSVDIQDNIAVDLQTILPETQNLKWLSSNLRWDNDGKGVYKAQIYAEASAEAGEVCLVHDEVEFHLVPGQTLPAAVAAPIAAKRARPIFAPTIFDS